MSPPERLPDTLRQLRQARRLSQLALSLTLGVSQRHISFVEQGRAQPSRALLMAWLQALGAPLAQRNAALLQAGFAPAYGDAAQGAPGLAQAEWALRHLLQAHDPLPALVLDAHWQVLQVNPGAQWLIHTLLPWTAELPPGTPMNMLDLLAHPQGLFSCIINLAEVAPQLMAQWRAELALQPSLGARIEAVEAALQACVGHSKTPAALLRSPVLTTRFASPFGELAFFSMFTTFGTPQDIHLASLRVEHLFAADEATRLTLEREVPR
ncbi:MAG: helix-turn-helix transcriptional regulator [Ideonella sp.]|nr:helix-turn-helix transcriptional regulator [Ideonella sp.]